MHSFFRQFWQRKNTYMVDITLDGFVPKIVSHFFTFDVCPFFRPPSCLDSLSYKLQENATRWRKGAAVVIKSVYLLDLKNIFQKWVWSRNRSQHVVRMFIILNWWFWLNCKYNVSLTLYKFKSICIYSYWNNPDLFHSIQVQSSVWGHHCLWWYVRDIPSLFFGSSSPKTAPH